MNECELKKTINKEQMKKINISSQGQKRMYQTFLLHGATVSIPCPDSLPNIVAILNGSSKTTQNVRFGVPQDTDAFGTIHLLNWVGVLSENWYVLFY